MGESQARREEGFEVDDPANGLPGGPPPPAPPDAAGSGVAAPPPPPRTPDTRPAPCRQRGRTAPAASRTAGHRPAAHVRGPDAGWGAPRPGEPAMGSRLPI